MGQLNKYGKIMKSVYKCMTKENLQLTGKFEEIFNASFIAFPIACGCTELICIW